MTTEFNKNDVLCGRGGATNSNPGNKKYRSIVQDHQPEYLEARKKDKAVIARKIVRIVRERGGRFLKRDNASGLWRDVGDKKATEKTSQALREGLDVRQQTGLKKTHRRHVSDSSNEGPTTKKRKLADNGPIYDYDRDFGLESPALVSLSGDPHHFMSLDHDDFVLFPEFNVAPVSAADCDQIAGV